MNEAYVNSFEYTTYQLKLKLKNRKLKSHTAVFTFISGELMRSRKSGNNYHLNVLQC